MRKSQADLNCRTVFRVEAIFLKPSINAPEKRALGFTSGGTQRSVMMVKAAHQTATVRKEIRTACSGLARPNRDET